MTAWLESRRSAKALKTPSFDAYLCRLRSEDSSVPGPDQYRSSHSILTSSCSTSTDARGTLNVPALFRDLTVGIPNTTERMDWHRRNSAVSWQIDCSRFGYTPARRKSMYGHTSGRPHSQLATPPLCSITLMVWPATMWQVRLVSGLVWRMARCTMTHGTETRAEYMPQCVDRKPQTYVRV
jgi:hypothetical protein